MSDELFERLVSNDPKMFDPDPVAFHALAKEARRARIAEALLRSQLDTARTALRGITDASRARMARDIARAALKKMGG